MKLTAALVVILSVVSCKKEEKEDTSKQMSGKLTFDVPAYVMTGQQVTATMSGITNPKDVQYFWVSKDIKISDRDTVFGNTITFRVPYTPGKYTLKAFATAKDFYRSTQVAHLNAIATDGSSLSGIQTSHSRCRDARDGEVYYIRRIGKLLWFTENLRYSGDGSVGRAYQNSEGIDDIFGRLYSWNEATGGAAGSGLGCGPQGICPEGWSVPTKEDWEDLAQTVSQGKITDFYGSWEGLGEQLSAKIRLNDEAMWPYSPVNVHRNYLGWNAIPSGNSKDRGQNFENLAVYGMWWSSLDNPETGMAFYRYIYYDSSLFNVHQENKEDYGMSVRCVKLAE